MPHVLKDLHVAGDPGGAQGGVQTLGVGVQDFTVAHLNQRRRKIGQVAEERGQLRGAQILSGGVGLSDGGDIVQRQHGVNLRPLPVGDAGGGHVCPGRHQQQRGGQHPPLCFQPVTQDQRQIAAGAVAGHHNVPSAVSQVHQVVPGHEGVFHGGGVGVLRGQPVFKGQDIEAGDVGEFGGQHLGIAQRAAGVTAAVTVQNGVAFPVGPLQLHPGGGHSGQMEGLPHHAVHGRHQIAQKFLAFSLLFQFLYRHILRRGGAVQCFQYPHGRGQMGGGTGRFDAFFLHVNLLLAGIQLKIIEFWIVGSISQVRRFGKGDCAERSKCDTLKRTCRPMS